MVLSDTVIYISILGLALAFSALSIPETEYRLLLKTTAAICWFINSLTSIYFFGGAGLLTVPLMFLFMGLGLIFCFSIVTDFKQKKRDELYGWMND